MITVTVRRAPSGCIRSFTVKGHAGYAGEGQDIVCAAVTALAQTAVLGLRRVARVEPEVAVEEGFLECRLPSGAVNDSAEAILETVVIGLVDIEKDYPAHVRMRFSNEEV